MPSPLRSLFRRNASVARRRPSTQLPSLVDHLESRALLSGTIALDLADIVGGGDGTGTGTLDHGFDPTDGDSVVGGRSGSDPVTVNAYQTVDQNRYIDGVFVPDGFIGRAVPVQVASDGTVALGLGDSSGQTWDHITNGPRGPSTAQPGLGTYYGVEAAFGYTSQISFHANKGVTFDLRELEADHANHSATRFTAGLAHANGRLQGGSDGARFDIVIDGEIAQSVTLAPAEQVAVDIAIQPEARFLTIVATSGTSYSFDQTLIGDPTVELTPTKPDTLSQNLAGLIGVGQNHFNGAWYAAEVDPSTGQVVSRLVGRTDAGEAATLTGDFDGDGRDDRLVQQADGSWMLLPLASQTGPTEFAAAGFAHADVTEFYAGDFDGDGRDDLLAVERGQIGSADRTGFRIAFGNGRTETWLTLVGGSAYDILTPPQRSVGDFEILIGDADADGADDLVLFNSADGAIHRFVAADSPASGGFFHSATGRIAGGLSLSEVQLADVDGNGSADFLARNNANGQWLASLVDHRGDRLGNTYTTNTSTNVLLGTFATNVAWTEFVVADLTGDGRLDIAGRHTDGGWYVGVQEAVVKPSAGTIIAAPAAMAVGKWGGWASPSDWTDAVVMDLNGDNAADLVTRNTADGSWWVALSDGKRLFNCRLGHWSANVDWLNSTPARQVDRSA